MNKRPLFLTAVFFLLGILYQGEDLSEILVLAICFLLWNVILRAKRRGIKQGVFYGAVFLAAFVIGAERMETEEDYRRQYEPLLEDGENRVIQGIVRKKEAGQTGYRYYLKHCYLNGKGSSKPVSCNQILVYLDTDDLSIGDTIIVNGKVQTLETARNEGNFDEKSFYQSQKIDMKFYGEKAKTVASGSYLEKRLYQKKEEVKEVYEKILGSKEAGVLSTMVLGDKELLDDKIKEIYQKAGISHILAISGLHISIIGMGLCGLLQRCGIPPFLKTVISSGTMALFALLVGAGVSTKRAVLMFFLLLLANLIGRSYDSLTSLAFTAMLILWENPFCYAYSGFVLSFFAVLGVNAGNLVMQCPKRGEKREAKNPNSRKNKVKEKLKNQLIGGIFIQVFTIPVIAWCYYELPVYVIFANLLILPTAGILLFLGIVGGILGNIYLYAGWLPLKGAGLLIRLYEIICNLFLKLPKSTWVTGKPSIEMILFFYIIIALLLIWIFYKPKVSPIFWGGMILIALYTAFSPKQNGFEIAVLDVGQGDGIYIESESGKHFFVDGGSVDVSEAGKYRILPFLKAKGAAQIDCWFVSHCDADHISGLKEVLEADYPVKKLVFSEEVVKDEALEDLITLAKEKGCEIVYLKKGDEISDGDTRFYACYPNKQDVTGDRNRDSLVLLLETDYFCGLLTGDIGKEEEERLIDIIENNISGERGRIDWYKAAHHGSKESNSKDFLEKLHPQIATISCGVDNSYGHPAAEAVANMKDSGAEIYETTKCGQITIGYDELPAMKLK